VQRDEYFHSYALPDKQGHGSVSEKLKCEALSYSWEDQVMRKETREKHPGVDLQNRELALWRPWKNETSVGLDSVCINESQKPWESSLFALKDFSRTAKGSFELERDILLELKSRTISDADQAVQVHSTMMTYSSRNSAYKLQTATKLIWNSSSVRQPVTSMTMTSPSTPPDAKIRDIYKKKPLASLPANRPSTQQHQNNTAPLDQASRHKIRGSRSTPDKLKPTCHPGKDFHEVISTPPFVFEGPSPLGDVLSCLVKHPSQQKFPDKRFKQSKLLRGGFCGFVEEKYVSWT
jgi:hypothetical protein